MREKAWLILALDARTLAPSRVFIASASPQHLTQFGREVWATLFETPPVENAHDCCVDYFASSALMRPLYARFGPLKREREKTAEAQAALDASRRRLP